MKAPKDQHFLVDADAVALIADTVPVSDRKVLEIGPGGGVLTDALLQRGALVRAVELDGTLIPNLNRRFSEQIKSGQLEIIRGDASKVPLPEFELVVANLPYSISSKITFRLLEIGFESAVLMYQLEFGKRMIAPPGNSEYGRLSVMAQTYAEVEMVLELPPEAFSPPPEVWSIVEGSRNTRQRTVLPPEEDNQKRTARHEEHLRRTTGDKSYCNPSRRAA